MTTSVISWLGQQRHLRRLAPQWLKEAVRGLVSPTRYQQEVCRRGAEALLGGALPEASDYPPRQPVHVGIVRDYMSYYVYNIRACMDLGLPFTVVDISGPDWADVLRRQSADVWLVWPSNNVSAWKQMYDERAALAVEALGKKLIPRPDELWLLDSKRRVAHWLQARGIPHPRTWVFYEEHEALEFVEKADLPLVLKTDAGASTSGVRILRNRGAASALVRTCFRRGLRLKRRDRNDRHLGSVIFQEYIDHDYEWRLVRIGRYYLCRRKQRVGDYASASGEIGWARPSLAMLDFVESVTDAGGFRSMAVDLFEVESAGGQVHLVNELQCVFGAIEHEAAQNSDTGRWFRDAGSGVWGFEPGYYYQNACANLRLIDYLEQRGLAGSARGGVIASSGVQA